MRNKDVMSAKNVDRLINAINGENITGMYLSLRRFFYVQGGIQLSTTRYDYSINAAPIIANLFFTRNPGPNTINVLSHEHSHVRTR